MWKVNTKVMLPEQIGHVFASHWFPHMQDMSSNAYEIALSWPDDLGLY